MQKESDSHILFVGTYPPRECGIATFTRDLSDAVSNRLSPLIKTEILAMNNNGVNIYNYPKKVSIQISDTDIHSYIEATKKVNSSKKIKLLCVQHEFGIFGGERGDYLIAFLELIKKPVIITFHSVIPNPDPHLKKVVQAISERVEEIVVMTDKAVTILRNDYSLRSRISVIPHGIPTVPFENQDSEKNELGLQGKFVLSSFGMLSQGKGYEQMIEALPRIVKKYPEVVYLIVGETHPIVRRRDGEEYRNYLERKIKKLGLQSHVKFYNKYLKLEEIIKFLKATDLYISPSKDQNQITSGTLAYAVGAGRVAVSTPFLHAKDLLTPDIGALAEFNNPKSFRKMVLYLIENPEIRKSMEKNAYYKTRYMTWANVARAYSKLFERYLDIPDLEMKALPEINTTHLENLTDDFGIIQFAKQSSPDTNSGYTLDDNARALIASAMHYNKFREFKTLVLLKKYLDYIKYVQNGHGRLYNLVNKDRKINYRVWSEDPHGRAIWALGYLLNLESIPKDIKEEAESIFLKAIAPVSMFNHPRSLAFALIGLYYYNTSKYSAEIKGIISKIGDSLLERFKVNSQQNWRWFDDSLTYGNSKIPEALIYAYRTTKDRKYLDIALESLNFLIANTFEKDVFIPIGEKGWYTNGKKRAYFDQQPVEVAYTIQTLLAAYDITGDESYKLRAIQAYQWFLGKNTLNQVVYNEITGGCHDGLGENAINLNQGAESTISYLLARLSLSS